jgi:hypothetical protein
LKQALVLIGPHQQQQQQHHHQQQQQQQKIRFSEERPLSK